MSIPNSTTKEVLTFVTSVQNQNMITIKVITLDY